MAKTSKEDLAVMIGQRLKELRKAKKIDVSQKSLGQKDVAAELGITKQAMSSYESGRHLPDYPILIDLADYYSCSVDYLLGREDKVKQTTNDDSVQNTLCELLHSLDTIAPDEKEFLSDSFSMTVNSLSINKGNSQRRDFIQYIGELHYLLAEYVEMSTIGGKRLSEQAKAQTLNPEDIAIEFARFSGFDDISELMDGIRRTGIKALISFSVNAKKALRIRTGWRNNDKGTQNSKQKETAKKFIELMEREE